VSCPSKDPGSADDQYRTSRDIHPRDGLVCARLCKPRYADAALANVQIIIATAHHIDQIALGEIVYAFGYTGLQILQQIVIADMTTLRYRCVLYLAPMRSYHSQDQLPLA